MPTDKERYLTFQARIAALRSSSSKDKGGQKAILDRIEADVRKKKQEFLEASRTNRKLDAIENEYLEVLKAQEIMDQIDEKRK